MKIDPHVHLRDGEFQSHKETLRHGFKTAWKAGLSAVFEMPNTIPALTSELVINKRIKAGEKALNELQLPLFHGILPGTTANEKQIMEVVDLWKRLFPKIPGLKMFAGQSTGNMGITEYEEQQQVYRTLAEQNYTGVLMVHCEKESLLRPDLFDPQNPETHLTARPPKAEIESVRDQIVLAEKEGFRGTLHICHISVPASLDILEKKGGNLPFSITCGITPHHALLSVEDMKKPDGILLKVNPPLRSEAMRKQMFAALCNGRIDWIETDHAPHTIKEKMTDYASGIPGLQFYSRFIEILYKNGLSHKTINNLTFGNIVKTFSIPVGTFSENPGSQTVRSDEYGFDPFLSILQEY
ncbi:MAG: dihydroorotase [Spirochaetales bacterium]|nr:dihydroorotase [Spirochaetales bacterium]